MAQQAELLSAIDSLGATSVTATVFRHTAPGREPLAGAGARLFGGRWNITNGPSTVYLARPVESCIAEFLRMAEGQGRGASSFLPRDVHVIDIDGIKLVDLRSNEYLAAVGLTRADLADEDWTACQQVGGAVEVLGYTGLLAPSATGVGEVVVLFERRIDPNRVVLAETRQLSDYL